MRKVLAAVLALGFFAGVAAAASLESTQANIHYNLALKQYQAQKLDAAKGSLGKALGLSPRHPQANLLTGIIASQQNRFADAIEPLKIAAAGLPNNPDVFNNLGVAYFQLGKLSDAEDAFKRVLELQPARADVAMNLGVLALRQKKYADAKAAFLKASAGEPANGRAWLGLGEAADGAGDRATGTNARAKALELAPTDKALRMELGERLYQAERLTEAAKVLEPLKGTGESGAEFLLGVLAYKQGAFDASRERFEAALADRPDYPEARYNLAITFYDQGRYDEALKQFQAVLDKHPGDEEARKNLDVTRQAAVRAYLKTGSQDFLKADYGNALDHWRQALALDPGNKVVKDLVDTAEAQMKLQADELAAQGQAAWTAGKKEDAIGAWAQALERDPANAAAKAGLDGAKDEVQRLATAYRKGAEADLAEGRLSTARGQAEKVLALDPAQGKALLAKVDKESHTRLVAALASATAAEKKGALGAQVDALERAVEAAPKDEDAQLRLNKAKVAFRQALTDRLAAGEKADKAGKSEEAVKQYRKVLELQASNPTAKEALKRLAPKASVKGMDPAQLEDLYYQGVYAYAAGETSKAETFWKKVLAADPKHALAKEALDRAQKRAKALSKG